jgi:adenine-specific DNA methylase
MQLINNATKEKLRGGFYTPEPIADFILKWAFNGQQGQNVLEPSCRDGVFLERMAKNKHKYSSVCGIELDKEEAKKSKNLKIKSSEIINDDFHRFCNNTDEKFDIVVGNPPYIRYQYFNKGQQKEAGKIFERVNLKYSKLTNAWVSFVIGSSLLLKDRGKLGFVLPAELLQVSYAKPLRNYLAHYFHKINIISFKKLVFPDIQQEVVLLLCERNGNDKHLIEHLEVEDADDLENIDITILKSPKKEIDFKNNKWTFYFLDQAEIDFLESLSNSDRIPKIKDFANVEVGITTGANDFFTVPDHVVHGFNLKEYAKPLVGRSVQVNSLVFTRQDWVLNKNKKAKAHLLVFPKREHMKENIEAIKYLRVGEGQEIHKGYKCRIRDEWQIMPSIKLSEALFIRRNNLFPKLIKNKAKAYTTDTMHRVFVNSKTNLNALVASFYNSLSFAFSEIVGRSYGGGVLELMPNEVGEILLPYKDDHENHLDELDNMLRQRKDINEILSFSNQIILKDSFGLTNKEIKLADNIWKKLSSRRLNRNK